MSGRTQDRPRILVVRLGAMGDVLHALPAAATLKHSFPRCHLAWAIEPRWAPLLDGNPFVDEVVIFERGSLAGMLETRRRLRQERFDTVLDFQGLLKSALVATMARADCIFGFHHSQLREKLAAVFYSHRVATHSAHVVDRNLELAAAAGASAMLRTFPVPPGAPEGRLPEGRFVLASPLGGWTGKQWPLEYYTELGRRLRKQMDIPLVVNGPQQAGAALSRLPETVFHASGLPGLIDATRKAAAVVGIDSGPLHLAAALGKCGVAVFGPTDPARNGPHGGSFTVLRSDRAVTTYKRHAETAASMREVTPDMVFLALKGALERSRTTGCTV